MSCPTEKNYVLKFKLIKFEVGAQMVKFRTLPAFIILLLLSPNKIALASENNYFTLILWAYNNKEETYIPDQIGSKRQIVMTWHIANSEGKAGIICSTLIPGLLNQDKARNYHLELIHAEIDRVNSTADVISGLANDDPLKDHSELLREGETKLLNKLKNKIDRIHKYWYSLDCQPNPLIVNTRSKISRIIDNFK